MDSTWIRRRPRAGAGAHGENLTEVGARGLMPSGQPLLDTAKFFAPVEEEMMKNLLIVLVLLVAVVAGLGFCLGWFTVGWDRADGKGHITGTLDEDKFKKDEN